MTGWILFAALAGLLVGFSSGIVIGIKSGAKAMTKEIERLLSERRLGIERVEIMSEEMLDLSWEDYLKIKPHQIFASGSAPDSPEGLHMTGSGKTLHWVAVKGTMQDWAMYCDWASDPWYIKNNGQKVYDPQNIKNVISVDQRVMDQYRFR